MLEDVDLISWRDKSAPMPKLCPAPYSATALLVVKRRQSIESSRANGTRGDRKRQSPIVVGYILSF